MPIVKTDKGCLIKNFKAGKYHAAIQGCNCFCVMGSGLAAQVVKELPEAVEADNATVRGSAAKLGKSSRVHYNCGVWYNAYTQFGTAKYQGEVVVNYKAIREFFTELNRTTPYGALVGIPMLGAGLAGGHWEAIETIIDMATPDINIEVVEYAP